MFSGLKEHSIHRQFSAGVSFDIHKPSVVLCTILPKTMTWTKKKTSMSKFGELKITLLVTMRCIQVGSKKSIYVILLPWFSVTIFRGGYPRKTTHSYKAFVTAPRGWSGCMSVAFRKDAFCPGPGQAEAHNLEAGCLVSRASVPWAFTLSYRCHF